MIRKIYTAAGSEERTSFSVDVIFEPLVKRELKASGDKQRSFLSLRRSGKKPPRQRFLKRRSVKLREPSFTKNLRHQILAVLWAFDRSARLLTEITYRRVVMRCRREDIEPKRSLRAEHRFYWRIWIRRTVANAAAGNVARRSHRLRRLVASLEQDADRISRKSEALLGTEGDHR